MQRPELAFGKIGYDAFLINVLQIDEESAVRRGRSYEEIDDRVTCNFRVRSQRRAGISQQFLVFFSAIWIRNLSAADLGVPAVPFAGGGAEVDRVSIFADARPRRTHRQNVAFVEIPACHLRP